METIMALIPRPEAPLAAPPADPRPALVYLGRLGTARSRRTMAGVLDRLVRLIRTDYTQTILTYPWHQLRYERTALIRTKLAEVMTPATANLTLAALRGVLRECWRLGLMNAEDFHRAIDLPGVKGTTLPAGRALNTGEVNTLFAALERDASNAATRDGAVLATLHATGIRRSELAMLDLADLDQETGGLRIRHGKGGRQRLVYLNQGAGAAVAAWLELRGAAPGPLFFPINHGDRILTGVRLQPQAVQRILAKRARAARITKRTTPHDIRRTFATSILAAGAPLPVVQQLMGHASVQTTAQYDRSSEDTKRTAAQSLIHTPYREARA
jgi:site-specific recombinase XerD